MTASLETKACVAYLLIVVAILYFIKCPSNQQPKIEYVCTDTSYIQWMEQRNNRLDASNVGLYAGYVKERKEKERLTVWFKRTLREGKETTAERDYLKEVAANLYYERYTGKSADTSMKYMDKIIAANVAWIIQEGVFDTTHTSATKSY